MTANCHGCWLKREPLWLRGRPWQKKLKNKKIMGSNPSHKGFYPLFCPGNTKWGSITVLLTSCLTGLESAV
jgi:hypothetical protein